MALNMAISNFEDLNWKVKSGSKFYPGSFGGENRVKRVSGVIWDQNGFKWGQKVTQGHWGQNFRWSKVGVIWGHQRSLTRKKPCSVDRFATGICQTNFWTSRMTLTQFWNIANLKNMIRISNVLRVSKRYKISVAPIFVLKPQIYNLWLGSFTVGILA